MKAPLVRLDRKHLVIRMPGHGCLYEPLAQSFRDEPQRWLYHMREKCWWTQTHERELARVLGASWLQTATGRMSR